MSGRLHASKYVDAHRIHTKLDLFRYLHSCKRERQRPSTLQTWGAVVKLAANDEELDKVHRACRRPKIVACRQK